MRYKDSLGNVYDEIKDGGRGKPHTAKPSTATSERRSSKHRLNGVTKTSSKYHRYRMLKGKPNGPGKPGNKSGTNKIR